MSHHTSPEPGTKTNGDSIKLNLRKMGGVVALLTSIILLFELAVPSKAQVSRHDDQIRALEARDMSDHDALVKLQADVEYIRKWVEKQERLGRPLRPPTAP